MKTLYIDVYFLLNFTVDLLSLYFAAMFSKVNSSAKRLILASAFGAAFACITALYKFKGILFILFLLFSGVVMTLIFCKKSSVFRKFKLFAAFLIFETFMGGIVNFLYSLLDEYLSGFFAQNTLGDENRQILLVSLMLLLSYGVIRILFIVFYGSKSEQNISMTIGFGNSEQTLDALIDSGNLLCDPFDGTSVFIVKKKAVLNKLNIKDNFWLSDDAYIKSRIRIIPAKGIGCQKIYYGIKCDYVKINDEREYKNVTLAIDDEEGDFGGYLAIAPASYVD